MIVILDKSYLVSASPQTISDLCASKSVVMTEALFFELLTTIPEQRADCFRKFPKIESPVVLTTNSGVLMRKECVRGQPINLTEDAEINVPFRFNDDMTDPNFSMIKKYQNHLNDWQTFMSGEVKNFKEVAGLVAGFFPELRDLKPGSSRVDIQDALESLSGQSDKVLEVYDQIRLEGVFPETNKITPDWIIYRHLQANLIAALEYIRKYGSGTLDAQSKKIENDVIDIEYSIFACLADALASGDTALKEMYLLSKPEGTVIQ